HGAEQTRHARLGDATGGRELADPHGAFRCEDRQRAPLGGGGRAPRGLGGETSEAMGGDQKGFKGVGVHHSRNYIPELYNLLMQIRRPWAPTRRVPPEGFEPPAWWVETTRSVR